MAAERSRSGSGNGPGRALVTGGGSGLGEALVQRLVDEGWSVIVADRDAERAATVADALGEQALPLTMDVREASDWAKAEELVVSTFGGLDVLVNNAGVATGGTLEESPIEDWQWVTDINLLGVVRGCRQFAPMMRRQGSGHIVNVASFAGLAGAPGINAYGTIKAAVVALSEQLRAELAPCGVSVSVLCPAFFRTRLMEDFRSPNAEDDRRRVLRWMETSGVTAADVADQVYRALLRPRFMILTHGNTRWAWRFKRFFPELYFRMVRRTAERMARKARERSGT